MARETGACLLKAKKVPFLRQESSEGYISEAFEGWEIPFLVVVVDLINLLDFAF